MSDACTPSLTRPYPHPYPLPEHEGVRPGQRYASRLGNTYEVYAVTSDGYVWFLEHYRGHKRIKRIWIDVVVGWVLVEDRRAA